MRKEYARLEQELLGDDYGLLLESVKVTAPFMRRFRNWEEVIAFMRTGTSEDPEKDEVLRPIFGMHQNDRNPRWRTILLVIFWPGLKSIQWNKGSWDSDIAELWQNIVWTFLEVVCRIDIGRRRGRLVQKVINDTIHHLHDEYSNIWKIKNHEIMPEGDEYEALVRNSGFSQEIRRLGWIRKLRTYMKEGRINEADFFIIVGTRVYGEPLVDYAREHGLDYQAVSKRRRRAEAAIRDYEKKLHESCPKK